MPGVFSVPDRRVFSWPPPICRAARDTPRADIKRADPFGRVDLVAGQGVGVRAGMQHIKGQSQKALHAVHVEVRARRTLFQQRADFLQGLHRAGFVVHLHTAQQHGIRGDQGGEGVQIHQAPGIVGDFPAGKAGGQAGFPDGGVFAGAVKHHAFPVGPHGFAQDGQVVAFCAAGGENDAAARGSMHRLQDLFPAGAHHFFRFQGRGIQSGRIEIILPHGSRHRCHRRVAGTGGGAVIQVNGHAFLRQLICHTP